MIDADVSVEAYSGYRFGERPRAFTWHGRRYEVLNVERRWRTPEGAGFVVTTAHRPVGPGPATDGVEQSVQRWELTYDEVRDKWHICRADVREDGSRGEAGRRAESFENGSSIRPASPLPWLPGGDR